MANHQVRRLVALCQDDSLADQLVFQVRGDLYLDLSMTGPLL